MKNPFSAELRAMYLAIGIYTLCEARGQVPFSEDFTNATVNPGWTLESPNPASTSELTGAILNITASWQNGGSDLSFAGANNASAPRLLQPVDPGLNWTIETKFTFAPGNNYQGAGLLLAKTNGLFAADTDFVRLSERAFSPPGGGQVVRCLPNGDYNTPDTGTNVWLRVTKAGTAYTGWWSADGTNWNFNGSWTDTNRWAYLGVFAIRQLWDSVPVDSLASFDYFHVSGVQSAAASSVPVSADFTTATAPPGWTLASPNAASTAALTNGSLTIAASWQNGGSDLWSGSNLNAPRLLQSVDPNLDWTIETEFAFAPGNNYQGAGLLLAKTNGLFQATTDCARFAERAYYPNGGGSVIRAAGNYTNYSGAISYMRLQKSGINYTGWWSADGVNWNLGGMTTDTNLWPYLGVFVIRQPWDGAPVNSTANVYYFHVSNVTLPFFCTNLTFSVTNGTVTTTNLTFCTGVVGSGLQVQTVTAGQARFVWSTQTNTWYLLQGTDELVPVNWFTVWGPNPGTGTNLVVPVSTVAPSHRFYRLLSTQ